MEERAENNTETKRNIFIVDDEAPIRKVLKTHLTREGYNVIESSGGNKVFEHLQSNHFDLVISDIRMPEVDGSEVLDYVTKEYSTIPIIMLTGLTDINVAIDIMRRGAFDYITKPVKKAELMNTIDKALNHKDLLERNKELERQNQEYQLYLEDKVKERTKDLSGKAQELNAAYKLLKDINIQFVQVMAEAIEAKDEYTRGHCDRMRIQSLKIGELLELSAEDLETLEYATILHDLGKIGVKETILNKPGKLTEEEFDEIKEHPVIGEKILEGITHMGPAAKIVGAHHENFDGTGYPRGLKGEAIPLASRIIAVADIFDSMYSSRPYRKKLSLDTVLTEIRRVSGNQLDPEIVELFLNEKVYLTTIT
ncbi:MAG: response regulator [Proteobacteria bacterium]|nr:response regulator [Pseudomonadota bacterium]